MFYPQRVSIFIPGTVNGAVSADLLAEAAEPVRHPGASNAGQEMPSPVRVILDDGANRKPLNLKAQIGQQIANRQIICWSIWELGVSKLCI